MIKKREEVSFDGKNILFAHERSSIRNRTKHKNMRYLGCNKGEKMLDEIDWKCVQE